MNIGMISSFIKAKFKRPFKYGVLQYNKCLFSNILWPLSELLNKIYFRMFQINLYKSNNFLWLYEYIYFRHIYVILGQT